MIRIGDLSDFQLATEFPIVVVGQWKACSGHTNRVEVLSVAKGSCPLGPIPVFSRHVLFEETRVRFHESVRLDPLLPSQPCVWFLQEHAKSRESFRIFQVDHGRAVQPLETLPYFEAMWSSDPAATVPQLLDKVEGLVVQRVLSYINGGYPPWPFDSPFHNERSWDGVALPGEADRVWQFLNYSTRDRLFAAGVFAELSGTSGIPRLRTLLNDSDPDLRALAVGHLAELNDIHSYALFADALVSTPRYYLGYCVVEVLSNENDMRLAPALVCFLECPDRWYGDPRGNAAYWACRALKRLTGCVFPYDTVKAKRHLQRLQTATTKEVIQAITAESEPLVAEMIDREFKPPGAKPESDPKWGFADCIVTIRITNRSQQELTIPTTPSAVELDNDVMQHPACGVPEYQGADPLVLAPGSDKSIFLRVQANRFFAKPGCKRNYRLCFWNTECVSGKKLWTGEVPLRQ